MRRALNFRIAALLLSVVPAALAAARADAQTAAKPGVRQRILVLQVKAEQGVPQGTANLLGEILLDDIHRNGSFDAISTADMMAMLDVEMQKQQVGCEGDTNCVAEIGAAMGADLILEASVGTVGVTRVLALKLIEARRAEVKARETESVAGDEALIGAAHRLIARLFGWPEPTATFGAEISEEKGLRPGWWVVGGGALLAAAGGVVGFLALRDYQNFRDAPFDDPLGDSAKTKSYVADGLFVAATAAVVAGAVWLVTSGGEDQP